MHKLEAHEVPLYKVFSSDYDFRIPDYQRPYAWQEEQAVQLLTDLDEALDRGSEEPYFLGSVVLVKDMGTTVADVIDGQQRLTTLTILLSVLRDVTEDEELRAELDRMVVEPGRKVLGLATKPRLALRSRDAAFFKKYVQDRGAVSTLLALAENALKTDAQRAVQANARGLHRIVSVWSEDRRLALAQILSHRTFLVIVSTPDLDSAHRNLSKRSRQVDRSNAVLGSVGRLAPAG
ncbi:DUF262 domain-containing protein [Streptomyces sp. NBC_01538]|uniref:DUF262 domain-containing protein n=1 Tax=Streptomyces sp. NBC_01538 TaxID=2903897 RepID=UPI00386D8E01